MSAVVLRAARAEDAALLGALALRSKAHWGYDAAFLESVREELTYDAGRLAAGRAIVAERHGRVVGFSTLDGDPPVGEVGNLFVDPDAIGSGVGRALWERTTSEARALGFEALVIESDPFAAGFYGSRGAVRDGEVPSGSIPGRMLPRFRYDLR